MLPYIIIFLFPVWIGIIQYRGDDLKNSKHTLFWMIFFIVLFMFYAFRYKIGFDYLGYCNYINTGLYEIYTYDHGRREYLSYILMHLAHMCGNPQLYFASVAAISLPLFYLTFKRYSDTHKEMMMAIILFLAIPVGLLYSFTASRQFPALAILFYATRFLLERKFIPYAVCVLLAMCFHTSAIVGMLFYFIASPRVKVKWCLVIGIAITLVIQLLKEFIAKMLPMFEHYFYMTYDPQNGGLSQVVLYFLIGCILLYSYPYVNSRLKEYESWLKCYWLGLIFCLMFVFTDPVTGIRGGMIGLTYTFLCIPRVMAVIEKNKYGKMIYGTVVFITFSVYMYGLINAGAKYIPYQYRLFWG